MFFQITPGVKDVLMAAMYHQVLLNGSYYLLFIKADLVQYADVVIHEFRALLAQKLCVLPCLPVLICNTS